jgi:pimeloyl-ACP methyl ester carboxylesterase
MERAKAAAVRVPVAAGQWLDGDLNVPERARGVVIFAHGSGSSRHSPRNQFVAGVLVARRMATLLMDLLTPEEDAVDRQTAHLRFDIALLADRLVATLDWRRGQAAIAALPVGLFGASTGAGAALLSAARRPRDVAAVVSRGGRPDLAGPALAQVTAPTLLIVGGDDTPVIEMNEDAARRMGRRPSLVIVPGASHLFEEPGTLERVAELAGDWFTRYLVPPDAPA